MEAGVRLVVSFKSGNKGFQRKPCLVLTNIRINMLIVNYSSIFENF